MDSSHETSKPNIEDYDADIKEDDDVDERPYDFWCNVYNKELCISYMRENNSSLRPDDVISRAVLASCIPEVLESEECSVFRLYYYLDTESERLIERNDKEAYASFLATNHDLILEFNPCLIFRRICIKGAWRCAAAFLESPLRTYLDPDRQQRTSRHSYSIKDAFRTALSSFHSDLVEVLYRHGANAHPEGYLLKFALSKLTYHHHLQKWIPNDGPKSFLKLIHVFYSSELKSVYDVVRLLASHRTTKQLEELCLEFIQNGKMIPLAALLTVSRDRLLMPSFEEGNLKDTPIMRSISELLLQDHMHEGFSDKNWNVALNFIHTLWMARDVLDHYYRYRLSGVKPLASFDFAYDLSRRVGVVHKLSDDYSDFINGLRPKFTSKLEEPSRSNCSRSISRSFVTKPTMSTNRLDFHSLDLMGSCSSRLSHAWQAINPDILKPVQSQLFERRQSKLKSCNVVAFARGFASITWIAKRSIK